MGGFGSGFRGVRKTTIEDCLTLSVSDFLREGALVPGTTTCGAWTWSYEGRDPHTRVSYVADLLPSALPSLRLTYELDGESVDYTVPLTLTSSPYGGRRWWFVCPLAREAGERPLRVAKLHLPPGARYFGSRQRYGLTYRSCQESGKYRRVYARIALELGTDAASVAAALRRRGM